MIQIGPPGVTAEYRPDQDTSVITPVAFAGLDDRATGRRQQDDALYAVHQDGQPFAFVAQPPGQETHELAVAARVLDAE